MKYNRIENQTWKMLLTNRMKTLTNEACDIYLAGLNNLKLPTSYIPTYRKINKLIQKYTNWRMVPTTQLVTCHHYYKMLAHYEFPAIITVRPIQQIEFYKNKKPDVIHEYFGHGPFLTHRFFSDFIHKLAKFSLTRTPKEQTLLSRLFWYTIEFGLIQTPNGLRVYGAGIIPSQYETQNALHGEKVERRKFDLVDILRTPLSQSLQKIYYVIESFEDLYKLTDNDLSQALAKAIY